MGTIKFNYQGIIIIVLAIVAGVLLFALQQKKSFQRSFEPVTLDVGKPAPDFTLARLDRKMVSLSDYRGKVVLVNIWATWCPPCVAEMPSIEKLYQQLKGNAFEILAVSLDEQGVSVLAPFMKKYNLTFPALIDTHGITKIAYKTTGVPESFIINKQGILAKKIVGPLDWSAPEVLGFLQQLIQKSAS
jgi:peroxiredoxin